MERDFAEELDELICASLSKVGADYEQLYTIAGIVFVVWILVAIVVYLIANYLIQQPVKLEDTNSNEVENNSSTSETQLNNGKEVR